MALCGASKGFQKAFKTFIKSFQAPKSSVKIKIVVNFLSLSGIGAGRVKILWLISSRKIIRYQEVIMYTFCKYCTKNEVFSINDFFSKSDQIPRNLRIWSHLLKKSLMENFIFCALKYKQMQSKTSNKNEQRNKQTEKKIWKCNSKLLISLLK